MLAESSSLIISPEWVYICFILLFLGFLAVVIFLPPEKMEPIPNCSVCGHPWRTIHYLEADFWHQSCIQEMERQAARQRRINFWRNM